MDPRRHRQPASEAALPSGSEGAGPGGLTPLRLFVGPVMNLRDAFGRALVVTHLRWRERPAGGEAGGEVLPLPEGWVMTN
jgi:hypothetical protein